jgi:D-alanyl-D-alanine carboxypeptidase (penicillin-binding protein 5/6)
MFERAADERRPNASTTKLVTALVVVDRLGLNDTVTVSGEAAATGGGGLDLQAGETYAVGDLLYSLLLSSSNDSAVALAERVSGSQGVFVEEMNAYVRSLGARDTNFVTAHGLDAPGHYSSARDLARIGEVVLEDPVLAKVVDTPRASIQGPGGSIEVENRNPLLETYKGAVGIKTGYTAGAGNVLVAAARRHGRVVIAVAMGSPDATTDSVRMLDYGFARLDRAVLMRAGHAVGGLIWPGGRAAAVVTARTYRGPYRRAGLVFDLVVDAGIGGRVEIGERVGEIVVTRAGRELARVPAVAAAPAEVEEVPALVEVLLVMLRGIARAFEGVS